MKIETKEALCQDIEKEVHRFGECYIVDRGLGDCFLHWDIQTIEDLLKIAVFLGDLLEEDRVSSDVASLALAAQINYSVHCDSFPIWDKAGAAAWVVRVEELNLNKYLKEALIDF